MRQFLIAALLFGGIGFFVSPVRAAEETTISGVLIDQDWRSQVPQEG